MRMLRGLSAAAVVFASVGCGAGADDDVAPITDGVDRTSETISSTSAVGEKAASTTDDADSAAEPIDSTMADSTAAPFDATPTDDDDDGLERPPSVDPPDEWSEVLDEAVPEAPAPVGLAGVVLPNDVDRVIALFDALPHELIGGVRSISARTPGDLAADYMSPDRASRYGFQAMDLPNSFMGSVLPEPRADMLVGFFVLSDDDDYTVETAGHDGDLYWVTLKQMDDVIERANDRLFEQFGDPNEGGS